MANYELDRYNTDSRVSIPRLDAFGTKSLAVTARNHTGLALGSMVGYAIFGMPVLVLMVLAFVASFAMARGK